jgi:hypothetical protein
MEGESRGAIVQEEGHAGTLMSRYEVERVVEFE